MKKRVGVISALILALVLALVGAVPVLAAINVTVVSDNTTQVTAGNVGGAYPQDAVETWVHPSWWSSLTGHTFSSEAKWIWESYRVLHPVAGDIVDFQKTFSIPGNPVAGTLYITCDNGYEVQLNGNPVGSAQLGAGWRLSNLYESYVNTSGWQSVESYDVTSLLVSGQNVMTIGTANEQMGPPEQSNGTVDSNPAGLLYEMEIAFEMPPPPPPVVPSMSGWGIIGATMVLSLIIPLMLRRRAITVRHR